MITIVLGSCMPKNRQITCTGDEREATICFTPSRNYLTSCHHGVALYLFAISVIQKCSETLNAYSCKVILCWATQKTKFMTLFIFLAFSNRISNFKEPQFLYRAKYQKKFSRTSHQQGLENMRRKNQHDLIYGLGEMVHIPFYVMQVYTPIDQVDHFANFRLTDKVGYTA